MIAPWYACQFHAYRLRGIGRSQFRRWDAALGCGENARGAEAGDCSDRPSLVMA